MAVFDIHKSFTAFVKAGIPESHAAVLVDAISNRHDSLVTTDVLNSALAELKAELKVEIADLKVDITDRFSAQQRWLVGLVFTTAGLVIAAFGFLLALFLGVLPS